MAGIHFAKGDVLISMDGDMQNDPADIAPLHTRRRLRCGFRLENKSPRRPDSPEFTEPVGQQIYLRRLGDSPA